MHGDRNGKEGSFQPLSPSLVHTFSIFFFKFTHFRESAPGREGRRGSGLPTETMRGGPQSSEPPTYPLGIYFLICKSGKSEIKPKWIYVNFLSRSSRRLDIPSSGISHTKVRNHELRLTSQRKLGILLCFQVSPNYLCHASIHLSFMFLF